MNRFFKDSLSLVKNYKWNSMFFRYFKTLIFVIIIPAVIFITIILNYYINSIKSDISTSQKYTIIKSVIQYDRAYSAIEDMTADIVTSNLTEQLVYNNDNTDDFYGEYIDFLNKEKSNYMYINSISVYNPKTQYVLSTYGSGDIETFRDVSWLTVYNSGNANFSLPAQPKGIENSYMINIGKNLLVNNRTMGVIIFTVDGRLLTEQMYAGNVGENEDVLIFSDKNELIYASDRAAYLNASDSITQILDETTYRQDAILKTKLYLYNFIASENYPFKLASALSMEIYNKNYLHIAYIMIAYFVVTFVLVVIFSLIVAFTFYRSIVDIVIKTSEMSSDIGINIEKENNELMYLSDTLFNTIKNHQKIENELVEKITKLKKVQSIALQTQINPHFLFNSLNLVNGFILEECHGESKAATILSNLSDILFIALNTKEYIVTVENEIEYAKKYLMIEQIKYPDKFDVEYDIDSETLEYKTVKFVLQPIIENAIEHGMKPLTGKKGIIGVSVATINNRLVFSVSDNGPRISEEKLEELEQRLNSDEIQETKHIGLSNVNQRIKLIFGDEYGVNIFSDDEQTVIDIIMPIKK